MKPQKHSSRIVSYKLLHLNRLLSLNTLHFQSLTKYGDISRISFGNQQSIRHLYSVLFVRLGSPSLHTQKHYALPLIRQSQDSYQSSQRQLQRQLPRSIMLVQVPNWLRLSEEAIQSDNPRRWVQCGDQFEVTLLCNEVWICGLP
ncbi:Hypothetical_protein [Hexamita inflata]|uniref:Hypothetical_protein n=1 Tax=Hexamita inflata TaxID=28002 RepID=A0AA86PZM4_9EUKA|nr:Hypothetical protein HINF_LOCUS35486 [Hexamita inflata]